MKIFICVVPEGIEFVVPVKTDADREIYWVHMDVGDMLVHADTRQFMDEFMFPAVRQIMAQARDRAVSVELDAGTLLKKVE